MIYPKIERFNEIKEKGKENYRGNTLSMVGRYAIMHAIMHASM